MQKPEDYKSTLSTCVVIQGPPGVGKTTLACMFPNPVIYDCDLNLRGPLKYVKDTKLDGIVGFNTIDIDENMKEVIPAQRYRRLTKLIQEDCKLPGIDTLVFDSMTKISQYMLDEVMRQGSKEEMTIKLWGDYAHLWKNFINILRMTGKYIVLIAHEEIEKDDHDGMFRHFIHMPGKNF
jgi:predicted AAA+ superfamily ATPase